MDNKGPDLSGTPLGAKEKEAMASFLEDLLKIPGIPLTSLILYGSAARGDYRPGRSDINLLVVVGNAGIDVLRSLLDPVFKSRRSGIAPLFLTPGDIAASVDIFPLKFMAIRGNYRVVYGEDPVAGLHIDNGKVVTRIRQRLNNMLLKMRRHYIVNGGQRLTVMMSQQVKRFVETLGFLLAVNGSDVKGPQQIIEASAREFKLDRDILQEIYALRDKDEALPGDTAEKYYGAFLDALKKASEAADRQKG